MRRCSVPDIGGFREWFERNFGDLCDPHNDHYDRKDVSMVQADIEFIGTVMARKWWFGLTMLAVYPVVIYIPLYYWYVKNRKKPTS